MYIDAQTLITAGGVLTAIAAFITLGWKLFKWIDHQKEQDEETIRIEKKIDKEIERLEKKFDDALLLIKEEHVKSRAGFQEELTLLVYGSLACLKGLKEQGCNGPVTEAINRLEKHINKKAHGQN